MTYDMTSCGNRIKALRKKNGWTQMEFAEMLEMSHSNLVKLENGYQGITIDTLLTMRELFQVPIDFILTGEEYDTELAQGLQQIIDTATKLKITNRLPSKNWIGRAHV